MRIQKHHFINFLNTETYRFDLIVQSYINYIGLKKCYTYSFMYLPITRFLKNIQSLLDYSPAVSFTGNCFGFVYHLVNSHSIQYYITVYKIFWIKRTRKICAYLCLPNCKNLNYRSKFAIIVYFTAFFKIKKK